MNTPTSTADKAPIAHWKRALIIAGFGLMVGWLLLPWAVYIVGDKILGPYAGGTHQFSDFYGDLMKQLLAGSWGGWLLVTGPYITLLGLQLIWFRKRQPK